MEFRNLPIETRVLAAIGCSVLLSAGCDGDATVTAGFTQCGALTCQPGQYCGSRDSCVPGCASDFNCAAEEVCQHQGTSLGVCVRQADLGAPDGGSGLLDGGTDASIDAPLGGESDSGAPSQDAAPPIDAASLIDATPGVDAALPDASSGCGDGACGSGESVDSCPLDCALDQEDCLDTCLLPCLGEPTSSNRRICNSLCDVATSTQIQAFDTCSREAGCGGQCLGDLVTCGDSRCDGLEVFEHEPEYCPADCAVTDGDDCFDLCFAYEASGCVDSSFDCWTTCFTTTPANRSRFLSCSASNECAALTCYDQFIGGL